jgi:hypothetical protein
MANVIAPTNLDPSDVAARAVMLNELYGASYPPEVLAGGPFITSVTPNVLIVGTAQTTLTVHGSGFDADSVIELDGTTQTTTFVTSGQLTCSYTPPASPRTVNVTVHNLDGTDSNTRALLIRNPPPVTPTLTSVTPNSAAAGATVAVVGTALDTAFSISVFVNSQRWQGTMSNRTPTTCDFTSQAGTPTGVGEIYATDSNDNNESNRLPFTIT